MSLSSTCIKRPVFATVMNIIMMLVGCIGLVFLGVRDYPSVDPPIISVSTSFPGANADVIETQITEPLESAINGIPGIRSLTSQSRDGRSNITVEFELEVDLETAANDVRDKVSGAMRRLPKDVDPPTVSKADADAQPIFAVSLRSDQRSLIDLSMYADQYYKERLQTISGVSSVSIWGEKRYSVRMRMDPSLLAAYGITPMDVRDAVTQENVELPSGRIEGENTELTIRTLGRLMTSLSTVLGILPMAIATGAGAESRVAMGIAVVGGMVCATFLSLFVIPAIYSYLSTEKVNVIGEEHKE